MKFLKIDNKFINLDLSSKENVYKEICKLISNKKRQSCLVEFERCSQIQIDIPKQRTGCVVYYTGLGETHYHFNNYKDAVEDVRKSVMDYLYT